MLNEVEAPNSKLKLQTSNSNYKFQGNSFQEAEQGRVLKSHISKHCCPVKVFSGENIPILEGFIIKYPVPGLAYWDIRATFHFHVKSKL